MYDAQALAHEALRVFNEQHPGRLTGEEAAQLRRLMAAADAADRRAEAAEDRHDILGGQAHRVYRRHARRAKILRRYGRAPRTHRVARATRPVARRRGAGRPRATGSRSRQQSGDDGADPPPGSPRRATRQLATAPHFGRVPNGPSRAPMTSAAAAALTRVSVRMRRLVGTPRQVVA